MITLEQATQTALEIRDYFDKWEEYKDFYVFSKNKAENDNTIELGGYDMPFVVMKDTGEVKGYSQVAVSMPEKLYPSEFVSEGTIEPILETDKEFNEYYNRVVEETIKKYN